jgi:peptidoglycan-associated lipoprotein
MSPAKASAALVVLACSLSACHKTPPAMASSQPPPAPAAVPARPPAPPAPPAAAARPAAAPLSEAEMFARKSVDALNAERPLGDVFFDYDQNTLRDDARRTLQDDAQWLKKWPSTAIRVDGHCDERGTAEYNLALGDRRAATVREYLENLGVEPSRVQVRSLGKESPFCKEDDESCWSQNRRGHFIITAK